METEESNTSDQEEEEQGKLAEYLEKLNDLLTKYERDCVIENAILNYDRFNLLLKEFMGLPEVLQLVNTVKDESKDYQVLSESEIT